jgi:hypothetical protein
MPRFKNKINNYWQGKKATAKVVYFALPIVVDFQNFQ